MVFTMVLPGAAAAWQPREVYEAPETNIAGQAEMCDIPPVSAAKTA